MIWQNSLHASLSDNLLCSLTYRQRSPPELYCIIKSFRAGCSTTSKSLMMFGWLSALRIRISLATRFRECGSVSLLLSKHLQANFSPVITWVANLTFPYAPSPSVLPSV